MHGLLPVSDDRWSAEVDRWGDDDTVRLEVIRSDGETVAAYMRINVQRDSKVLLAGLLERFEQAGLALVYSTSEIRRPSLADVVSHLRQSLAFKLYCRSDASKESAWVELVERLRTSGQ